MIRTSTVVVLLCIAAPFTGIGQSTAQNASLTAPISSHEAHDLTKSARSVAQFRELAEYFRRQESDYRADAAAEKVERDRRATVYAGLYQKYPRPVDSAQYLYDSYLTSANVAALQAQRYEHLAGGQGQHEEQLATNPLSRQ
jgi:hypothetical protein